MLKRTGLASAIALVVFPLFALAQGGSPAPGDLELKAKKKTTVVQPKPPAGQAAKDADAVTKRVETKKKLDEATKPAPPARPDLDAATSGGVQTKKLQRELKK
jgi:hypothetical protein